MSKKQMYGIIVAGIVFVFICVTSMLVNSYFGSIFTDVVGSSRTETNIHTKKYVPVVKIKGSIQEASPDIVNNSAICSSKDVNKAIDEYMEDDLNEGILLYIDSPGGTVSDSDKIYSKLMEYKKETNRPVWAYMNDYGCSGAYYIAMAADKIYADKNAVVGNIGVLMETMNYQDLLKKIGVDIDYIASSNNKTMGYPGRKLTKEQRGIYQGIINEYYARFIDTVDKGRKDINKKQVKKLSDGRVYTAKQATSNKLIDGIKTYEETKQEFNKEIGSAVDIEEKEDKESIFDILKSVNNSLSSKKNKNEEQALLEYLQNNESGGLRYEMPR